MRFYGTKSDDMHMITVMLVGLAMGTTVCIGRAVAAAGAAYFRGYVWDCLFAGIHFSFSGYFCAYGRSELSFLQNIISVALARVPGSYLTSKLFPGTLFPMGLATALSSLLSVILCVVFYQLCFRRKQTRKGE